MAYLLLVVHYISLVCHQCRYPPQLISQATFVVVLIHPPPPPPYPFPSFEFRTPNSKLYHTASQYKNQYPSHEEYHAACRRRYAGLCLGWHPPNEAPEGFFVRTACKLKRHLHMSSDLSTNESSCRNMRILIPTSKLLAKSTWEFDPKATWMKCSETPQSILIRVLIRCPLPTS